MPLTIMEVTSFAPRGGVAGTQVTVAGAQFGVLTGKVIYDPLAQNIEAVIVSWDPNQIVFTVPAMSGENKFFTVSIQNNAANDAAAPFKFWIPAAVIPPGIGLPGLDYQLPNLEEDTADQDGDDPQTFTAADFNRLLDRVLASGTGGLPPLIGSSGGVPPVLMEEPDGSIKWRCLTANDLCDPFGVSLSPSATFELGDDSVSPQFNASYLGAGAPVFAELTDNDGNAAQNILSVPNPIVRPFTYVKTAIGAVVVFTASANELAGPIDQSQVNHTWLPRTWWGVGTAGQSSEAFIKTLAGTQLDGNRQTSFTLAPGAAEKMYYAYPEVFGDATFFVNSFEGGFLPATIVSLTNAFGVTMNYRIYESALVGLGSTSVVVA